MSQQKNISFRTVLRLIAGVVMVMVFFVVLVAASYYQNGKTISSLHIKILNENDHNFIQKTEVETLIKNNAGSNPFGKTLDQLNLDIIEKTVADNPWVMKAEVYLDNNRQLNVEITQRIPVARLFHTTGSSAYLDTTLRTLPLSNNYAYQAPVFTGVPYLGDDTLSKSLKMKIAYLSSLLSRDTFWNAQITQIEVRPDQTFELIPLLGTQRILFGDTSFAEDKLRNLFVFYREVSNNIGWDQYKELDLRFRGQIIARPALGYVPPPVTDTATAIFVKQPEKQQSKQQGSKPGTGKTKDKKPDKPSSIKK